MKRLFPILLIATGLAASSAASAGTQSAYDLIAEKTFTVGTLSGSFSDVFNFSFTNGTSTQARFDFGFSDVTSANFSYQLVTGNASPVGPYISLPLDYPLGGLLTTAQTSSYAITPGTHYSLYVSGYATGDGYSVSINPLSFAAPVPEPGEWALMLSGLALLGGIARRRSARPTAV